MSSPAENASLPELVRTLADDARELVRAEVGLAKDEVTKTGKALLVVVAGATSITTTLILALGALIAATVLSVGGSAAGALFAAGGWGILLVVIALAVSARFLAKSSAEKKNEVPTVPQPEVRAVEPGLSPNQSEVLR